MKQMSDVETTTSSRPAFPTVLMALPRKMGCERPCLYHSWPHASTAPRVVGGRGEYVSHDDVIDFYDRHPISESQVLAAVRRRRGLLTEAPLSADDLFEFDQDHYGGL